MKELALELRIYTGDHDDLFPPASRWCDAIQSTNKASFHCRAAPKKQTCSYAMNRNLDGLKDCAEIEPETVLLFESDAGWNAAGGPEMAATRRHYQMHVAFVNGHVESFNYEDFRKLHWSPYTNSSAVKTK
ncbi:MAG: hypothetical protein HY298_04230 [Verrucomicrobia bacterium]|nr:hypothetical protein [Verrucomicrobiota bacterium]